MEQVLSLPLYGSRPGVELSAEFLDAFGHPERDLRIVHIAGTNGKGTTAAYTAGILRAAGYRTGLYTSPHLTDIRERIAVDGQKIDEAAFVRITGEVLSAPVKDKPTMSDVLFTAALLFFKERECDFAVIETGLGGRLDSTAAVECIPEVTAIPKIGIDHTAILGTTLEAIAAEKAGIIKTGTKVVIGRMDASAAKVIRERAAALSVPVIRAEGISVPVFLTGEPESERKPPANVLSFELLRKSYLYENICTAAAVTKELIAPEDRWQRAVTDAIAAVRMPGRLELLSKEPYLLFDGAHNPQGAAALADTLMKWYPGERFIFIIGCFWRPDYEKLLENFVPIASCVYPVDILHERNLGAAAIAEYYLRQGVETAARPEGEDVRLQANGMTDAGLIVCADTAAKNREAAERLPAWLAQDALCRAKERALGTGEKIIVCGSLHLYAELIKDGHAVCLSDTENGNNG